MGFGQYFLLLNLSLTFLFGCPKPGGYKYVITASLAGESVDFAHAALLQAAGLKGFLSIQDLSVQCQNYIKRLPNSKIPITISECWNKNMEPLSAWHYVVEIYTSHGGFRSDVTVDMDLLAKEISESIVKSVPDVKISVQSRRMAAPM